MAKQDGHEFIIGPHGTPVTTEDFDAIYSFGQAQDNQLYVIGKQGSKIVTKLFPLGDWVMNSRIKSRTSFFSPWNVVWYRA